jgi:hypothetical protein
VGVLLAYASLESLVALIPISLPANSPVTINATVLGFAVGATLVTALLFGLVPALKLSRAPMMIGTMLTVAGRGRAALSKRAGQWLIGAEVALALVLLTGSGLLLRSFAKLVSVNLGFDSSNVLVLEVEPVDQTPAMRRQYYASLTDALRRLPEVVSAGAIDALSLNGGSSHVSAIADTGVNIGGPQRTVLPGYLESMGVRPLAGRLFEDTDRATGDAAIVNAAAAEEYFAGDALGHTVRATRRNVRHLRIVGVVPNIRHGGPQRHVRPELYVLPDPNGTETMFTRMAMVMRLPAGSSLSVERLKQVAEAVGPRVQVGQSRRRRRCSANRWPSRDTACCCSPCLARLVSCSHSWGSLA